MLISDILNFDFVILLIELIGSLLLMRYVIAAVFLLLRGGKIERVQYLIADGAIIALNFKLAGTLLKTIELKTWQQISIFSIIFLLRTLLKRLFTWESHQIQRKQLFTER